MKSERRKKLIKNAIYWSLIQKKYKNIIQNASLLEAQVMSRKMKPYGLSLIKQDARIKIEKCKKMVRNNFTRLLYKDLEVPFEDELKVFGEVSTDDYLDEFIIEETIYHTVDYISSLNLREGAVFLTELNQDLLEVEQISMMLDLNTGEYVRVSKEALAKCKPVRLVLDKLVRNPLNY